MLILSLDSAGSGCAACLWRDGAVLALVEEKMERGQDARLVPLVQSAMMKAGVAFSDLDKIAVTRGPGSFTGLRIGLAAARGFGLAAEKPVVGIDRFAVHRAQQEGANDLLVVLESRRLELYVRFYSNGALPDEPALWAPTEAASFLGKRPNVRVAGDAPESLRALVAPELFLPLRAAEAVTCAALAATADPGEENFLPRPLYLRAPDVTIACGGAV